MILYKDAHLAAPPTHSKGIGQIRRGANGPNYNRGGLIPTSFLGVAGLEAIKFEVTANDPVTNVFSLVDGVTPRNGIFIFGLGAGASFYPGIYSIARNGSIYTILAAEGITSITSTGTSITVNKGIQTRATGLWIKIQA